MNDAINSSHYKSECSLECYKAMIMVLGVEGFINFCLGNAFKYMWRYKYKRRPKEDLDKSNWYLNKAIEYSVDYDDDLLDKAQEMKDVLAGLYSMVNDEFKEEESEQKVYLKPSQQVTDPYLNI